MSVYKVRNGLKYSNVGRFSSIKEHKYEEHNLYNFFLIYISGL